MSKYVLAADIHLICQTVTTFPLGITEVFQKMSETLPESPERSWYGISYFDKTGAIVYKAAALEMQEGEGAKFGYEPFVLEKGEYLSKTLKQWRMHMGNIKVVIMELMDDPMYDSTYPCIEWYKDEEEMICMVKSKV